MSVNSLDASISVGVQSAKGTAATAYKTALATTSGVNARFDERPTLLEHPGSGSSVPWELKAVAERTGYLVPVNATFLLRPRFIGPVLRGVMGVSSVNNTTHYTHTFTPATNANLAWLTVLHKFVGDSDFERKITDVRLTQLNIDATLEQVQCQMQGMGLTEGIAAGTETKVAEIGTEISPYSGSVTWTIAGDAPTSTIRGAQVQITQTLDENDRVLFSQTRANLPRQRIAVTGTVRGVDIDADTYEAYKLTKYGSAAGTAPTLTAPTGPLTLTFQSLSNISGAAVPFRLTMAFAKVQWDLESPNANNDDTVRADITWRLVGDSSPAMTFTVVSDQATP